MDVQTISCVYFSPTGTTRTIIENIAAGMHAEQAVMVDMTKRSNRTLQTFDKGIVIIGVPVYYGRVPEEAVSRLELLTGNKTPAVIVAVYGNRAYDDALKELFDIATARGFIPIAAGAFIGEHSYSSSAYTIGQGRPDASDLEKARAFGDKIREKVLQFESVEKAALADVPGNFPYVEPKTLLLIREARKTTSYAPETDMDLCIRCGKCAEICPTGAVSPDEPYDTDKSQCIVCQACVKICPVAARQMNNETFGTRRKWLYDNCRTRKEPEWYI
jgi:ferredoxin